MTATVVPSTTAETSAVAVESGGMANAVGGLWHVEENLVVGKELVLLGRNVEDHKDAENAILFSGQCGSLK